MNPDSRDKEIKHLKSALIEKKIALREGRKRELALKKTLRKSHKAARKDLGRVIKLFDKASEGADRLLNSFRWKRGTFLCKNKSYDPLQKPIEEFRQWKEENGGGSQAGAGVVVPSEAKGIPFVQNSKTVDVVICIHNALDFVKICLNSVVKCSPRMQNLILVNDGSDEITSQWLKGFVETAEIPIELIHNREGKGYTLAANQGMRRSDADYVVLLNSDTVVPMNWLEMLLVCGESDEKIGIIGPLSNAASWQSVPERFEGDDWAVNELPKNMSVDHFAFRLQLEHRPLYPRVPLINGFCLAIKRTVFKEIGYFDEEHFPVGYGEENDFCLRAGAAGFELAIADNAYIFHAKSKSFTHERRRLLSKDANKILFGLHSEEVVAEACESLQDNEGLEAARQDAVEVVVKPPVLRVLYLLPFAGGGGGVHSVFQEAGGLRKRGVFAQIAIKESDLEFYLESYPGIDCKVFCPFETEIDLIKMAQAFDAVIATMNTTVNLLERIISVYPEVIPGYYIQDYEPLFYEEGSQDHQIAHASYTKIPDMVRFAKTKWIVEEVQRNHGVPVQKVVPSIDSDIYFSSEPRASSAKVVCAMVRPQTPRRSPKLTTAVLEKIRIKYGDKVEVVTFGCPEDDDFWKDNVFKGKKVGILKREEVADLLKRSWLFLDLSTYQAFGRTGLEAMASGCATILPREGGAEEYAVDGENCLLIDAENEEEIMQAADRLLSDEDLQGNMVKKSLETAGGYSIDIAAESIEALFQEKRVSR